MVKNFWAARMELCTTCEKGENSETGMSCWSVGCVPLVKIVKFGKNKPMVKLVQIVYGMIDE